VNSAVVSANIRIFPLAPDDSPHALITNGSLTAMHAIMSYPFNFNF
jgi:hypothetical protein